MSDDYEMTLHEASIYAEVDFSHVWREYSKGKLAAEYSPRHGRVMTTRAAVDKWLANRRKPGRPRKQEIQEREE